MNNQKTENLADITMASYIQKACALIGLSRKVGGNQFRHAMATMAILIDYKIIDPVLLKASLVHDIFEDTDMPQDEIRNVDEDGPAVVDLVLEVTKRKGELKKDFLKRILVKGSKKAKILKVADRISNLTDLHHYIFKKKYISKYVAESEKYVLPMALEVNELMAIEIKDLIDKRRKMLDSL